jgi:cytidylate kinase
MHVSTIALDGPASSGKTTVGALLAGRLNFLCFDTGVMYRAVTLMALRRQVPIEDEAAVTGLAAALTIDILPPLFNDGRQWTVLVDGEDVTWAIRAPEVEAQVSPVSAYPKVREILTQRMQAIGKRGRVVMVGRDIGTVVLPEADLKIFLTASAEERARRRHAELTARGIQKPFDEILATIRDRDRIDSTRKTAPLKPATDAHVVDTTGLSIEAVVAKLYALVKEVNAK